MSEQRYCVDCRWYKQLRDDYCTRRKRIDLVTGPETSLELCAIARGLIFGSASDDPCGKEGRYWEPKRRRWFA